MAAYESALFEPPAPVAYVTLRNSVSGATWTDAPMLLDTGADVTLIPRAALEKLGLTLIPDLSYELAGYDGRTNYADVVQLELVFCRRTFRGQFLLVDQPWGIIGRNVLNAVALLFHGP